MKVHAAPVRAGANALGFVSAPLACTVTLLGLMASAARGQAPPPGPEPAAIHDQLWKASSTSGPLPADYWQRFDQLQAAHREERDRARQLSADHMAGLVDVAERQDSVYRQLISALRRGRNYTAAGRMESALVEMWTEVHGAKHWRVIDAQAERAQLDRLARLPSSKQDLIEEANREERRIQFDLQSQGAAKALSTALAHLQYRQDLIGEADPDCARSLDTLGMLCRTLGDLENARHYLTQSWQLRRQLLGEAHPQTAISLNNLGHLHHQAGEYPRALTCFRQALAILDRQLDHRHPAYRAALNNLAVAHQSMGDHVRAGELLREAYEVFLQDTRDPQKVRERRKAALPGLTAALTGDSNWSGNLYARFFGSPLPTDRPEQARLLNNLARTDMAAGDLSAALKRLTESRTIHEGLAADSRQPSFYNALEHASCLNNLALCHILRQEPGPARPLLERSLELRKKKAGETRPEYATGLTSLAFLNVAEGHLEEARSLLRKAAAILERNPGRQSAAYAHVLGNLALIDDAQGHSADAVRTLAEVLRLCAGQLGSSSAVQYEREQLALLQQLRGHLDAFLALALKTNHDPEQTYAPVLAWKGSVFARQRRIRERRLLSQPGHAEAARILRDLEDVTRKIGRKTQLETSHSTPSGQKELAALERQKEENERQLAAASAEVRARKQTEAMTPDKLRSALPRDAALVDFLEYTLPTVSPTAKRERRLAAFVVRREGPVVALDLGRSDPVVDAVARWRKTTHRRHPVGEEGDPAALLRKQVWEPVARHLGGAKLVLVSPDGALGKLPFAALPGKDRDTYLLEELTIVTLAVPQELPRLLAAAGRKRLDDEPTVLLVGDVDFDAGTERQPRGQGQWTKLPGTRGEMLAVRDTFERKYPFPDGEVRVLRGARATEALFREQAPKHHWLHLATHGFFASPRAPTGQDVGVSQARGAFHPGVLSGLVLAGANCQPPAGGDDGILTAIEIAEMSLNGVDGAVLSACETGLGAEASGEGLLGLQRAFQTAGVRTVIASLWSIDDAATTRLMEQFYENLWQKGLAPADALRQAQLSMLRDGAIRGMLLRDETEPSPGRPARVSPKYWAPFVLSGDWR